MNKNPLVAFMLSVIPGAGHLYLNKNFRGVIYFLGFFGAIFLAFLTIVNHRGQIALPLLIFSFFIWCINILDMILTLVKRQKHSEQSMSTDGQNVDPDQQNLPTIFLSFIPGLGHMQLGLMNRGLTFIVAFFGLLTMIFFISFVSHQNGFLVFVGLLPIIWIYSFFDVFQQIQRKQRGEALVDNNILEDFEAQHENGRKSKPLAILFSIFPGAGHLYLGLQKRGIQLMAAFLLSIYILDVLRISAFLFLIPLIWFYSFFDALQKASKYGEEELEDEPIIAYFANYQKWIGIALIVLGLYYVIDSFVLPVFGSRLREIFNIDIVYLYPQTFQTVVVCLLLIGGGIKLLTGSKGRKENDPS